ncbi:hypothetical protein LPC08_19560 [Roseomonas sp. OT10]|uniref:hypothetical protein n=1 Tax=Roseomonas cutis TaxID=2897332 RepID=UPI001E37B4C7|nr:hypothetical protein [Roseomonas sp. OT10]UFN48191.1 hypothetical protein LPC08_19560 [Roseomonas sp. OT10]
MSHSEKAMDNMGMLNNAWGIARLVDPGTTPNEMLVGLYRDDGNAMGIHGGLRHYVYDLNGTDYSWGQRFASIAQMNRGYQGISQTIAL